MTRSLRDRLSDPGAVVALGAHDGLTARIAERSGIEAIYHGGYATAAHHFGLPDVGLVGRAEVVESVRRVRAATGLPIVVDADTGYGSEAGVWLTVRELEAVGADAIQIEDQVSPKRCGHMEGKEVIPAEEMAIKVRAAVAARRSEDTLIIARSDALQVTDLDDVIHRCNTYADAGADLVFVDAPRTVEEVADIAERCTVPCVANMSETGRSPTIPTEELETMGYKLVIFPSTQTWLFDGRGTGELVVHIEHDPRARLRVAVQMQHALLACILIIDRCKADLVFRRPRFLAGCGGLGRRCFELGRLRR